MDDSCAVCAKTLEWTAYGQCGHREVCSTCVARLRFICNDQNCCICKSNLNFIFVTKALGEYTSVISDFSVFPSEPKEEEFADDEYSIEDNEPCVGDGEGGGGISLGGTSWDKEALAIAEEVTLSFEGDLGIYAFKTFLHHNIRVRIVKLSNKSGSPNIQDIEAFQKLTEQGWMKLRLLDQLQGTYH